MQCHAMLCDAILLSGHARGIDTLNQDQKLHKCSEKRLANPSGDLSKRKGRCLIGRCLGVEKLG